MKEIMSVDKNKRKENMAKKEAMPKAYKIMDFKEGPNRSDDPMYDPRSEAAMAAKRILLENSVVKGKRSQLGNR